MDKKLRGFAAPFLLSSFIMDIHSVKQPTTMAEHKELCLLLKKFSSDKKVRAQLRRKIKYDGFTDLDLALESLQSPPAEPEPEPEVEESPQEDP